MGNNEKSDCDYKKVPIIDVIPENVDPPPKYGYGVRHIQLVLALMCLTVNIIGRGHMGVTIVAMTSNAEENVTVLDTTTHIRRFAVDIAGRFANVTEKLDNNTFRNSSIDELVLLTKAKPDRMTYDWPKTIQEMVLNAFFLGYMIMMFPMGLVIQRFGGKLPLQIALVINAVSSIATPWLTMWGGWKAVCCCRIIQGLSQAGTYPCMQALLAKWVPVSERAVLSSCVYSGLTIGTIIAYQMAGFLAASPWGWPSIFYAVGLINIVTYFVLTVFGSASPLEHKTISEAEKSYIIGSFDTGPKKKLSMPWKAAAKSVPLWATIAANVGSGVAFIFFFNQVPTYIHHILGVNVKNSGLLSSLPYVASFFSTLGFGWASDYCTNNNIVSTKNARRICNSISQFGLALCLILTSYTNNVGVAVTCLVVALAANMGLHTGFLVNYIDLAPNFSGSLTATGNTFTNLFIVLTPFVVSSVVTDMTNQTQWRIMFFIIAGLTIICNTVFVVLISTDSQPWNNAPENDTCIEDAKGEQKKENEKL